MKLLLKITTFDRIRTEMDAATVNNRAMDCILITQAEYEEFRSDPRVRDMLTRYTGKCYRLGEHIDCTIATRDFPMVSTTREAYARGPVRYRAISIGDFFGVPAYVVPAEYIPK